MPATPRTREALFDSEPDTEPDGWLIDLTDDALDDEDHREGMEGKPIAPDRGRW